jgi:hypothetical protein
MIDPTALINFGIVAVFLAAVVVFVILAILNWDNPAFWAKLIIAMLPLVGKRASPELEAKAQQDYRRGGTGDIPLRSQRPETKKSIFGKTNWFKKK